MISKHPTFAFFVSWTALIIADKIICRKRVAIAKRIVSFSFVATDLKARIHAPYFDSSINWMEIFPTFIVTGKLFKVMSMTLNVGSTTWLTRIIFARVLK